MEKISIGWPQIIIPIPCSDHHCSKFASSSHLRVDESNEALLHQNKDVVAMFDAMLVVCSSITGSGSHM